MKYKPLNILQIFASKFWGGGEQYVYDLSVKLLEDKSRVFFVHRKSKDIENRIGVLNRCSCALPLRNCFDLYSIVRIAGLIKKQDIDLIHTHQFKDAFIALFARIISRQKVKIILSRHLVRKAKTGFLYTWLYKQIDKIIFVSQFAMDRFLSSAPVIGKDKMVVVHNSIVPSLPEETALDLRTKYGLTQDDILLVFTGRISSEKGIDILIRSLSRLKDPNVFLFIVGKGKETDEKELRALVVSSGLENNVYFTGFVENVQTIINQSDIGILPSVVEEAFGLSAIEFMQAGKPVITTDNGAQKEYIVPFQDGILVPPSDVVALSESIRFLAGNKEKRLEIGRKAGQTFERKLSYSFFYDKIIFIYNEVNKS
ncbi:MAG: glycosyltransferase family 4 protein [Prevotellaceae bacterium]|jgi:glycosyltransferase involved in cell wall biosynthesis|nr:glycosyltransferase family 4 protein [Prevotellaceae bacterium]